MTKSPEREEEREKEDTGAKERARATVIYRHLPQNLALPFGAHAPTISVLPATRAFVQPSCPAPNILPQIA